MFQVRKIKSGEGAETPPGDVPEVLRFHYGCLLASDLYRGITVLEDDSLESALLAAGWQLEQVRGEGSAHSLLPLPPSPSAAAAAHRCSECGGL